MHSTSHVLLPMSFFPSYQIPNTSHRELHVLDAAGLILRLTQPLYFALLPSAIHCPPPPSVGVTPSESVLSVGDPLMLTCTGGDCVGTTTFTFSWLLDGNLVDASLVTGTDGTTSQLSVTSVTSADFGTYTCQAMSIHGTGEAVAYVREAGQLIQYSSS